MAALKEKVVIVTGAGSGIGAASAKHFATLSAWLALNDFREEGLQETVQECIKLGLGADRVLAIPGDLAQEGIPELLVQRTVEHFGRLDVLLNIAGIAIWGSISEASLDDIHRAMGVNFEPVFRLTQLSIPHLKKTEGNVVCVSSGITTSANGNAMAYGVSKAAVDHLVKSSAIELAQYGIRVNSVNPGYVRTNILMNSGKLATREDCDREWDQLKNIGGLLKRIGKPEEIAKALAFLASNDASYVTGVNLLVDGGLALVRP